MAVQLHLFSDNYPYGNGESFLNNEIPYLVDEFEEVKVYPYQHKGEVTAVLKEGYRVNFIDSNPFYSMSILDYLLALKIHIIEFLSVSNKLFYIRKIRFFQAQIKEAIAIASFIKNSNAFNADDAYYSYWMNINALALAILKDRGIINKFVFRVNGWDVYDERHEGNFLPFRKYIYSKTEKVIAVSKAAMNYIKEKNIYPEKIDCSYFGTEDFGSKTFIDRQDLVLFSCSSIIPLKRVHLIVEILKLVPISVIWVHHGSGKSEDELLNKVKTLPENIVFKHSKYLAEYHDVLVLEKKLAPDLFISLSETEGLPVTMMEATSMGIPVLATDVGGCNEIVNETTGILIPKDFNIEKVANLISNFKSSNKGTSEYCQGVRNYWLNNFTAKKNYKTFATYLKQIFE